MLIAVAPTGARKTRRDHPALPITPLELAQTAAACLEVGAAMMHLHVRDANGAHSLAPELYREAIGEVKAAVGDRMLIQVTSESAGVYAVRDQMDAMQQLAPHCMSCGVREFVRDETELEQGARFFHEAHRAGTLIQYILYDPEDVKWYETLCGQGVIPGKTHLLLFVLGRYCGPSAEPDDLSGYVDALERASNWMAAAFGRNEQAVMQRAAELGGHARVGLENNTALPGGEMAPDNRTLVEATRDLALSVGRECADREQAESLFS